MFVRPLFYGKIMESENAFPRLKKFHAQKSRKNELKFSWFCGNFFPWEGVGISFLQIEEKVFRSAAKMFPPSENRFHGSLDLLLEKTPIGFSEESWKFSSLLQFFLLKSGPPNVDFIVARKSFSCFPHFFLQKSALFHVCVALRKTYSMEIFSVFVGKPFQPSPNQKCFSTVLRKS